MRYGFAIDQRTCIGCHACTVACKTEHEVPVGQFRTWVKYVDSGEFPATTRDFGVMRCNHCTDAPCVKICPTNALFKRDDGIVDFDRDSCIGCKGCMQACPYDAIYIDEDTNTAAKCNFCAHRVDEGLEPACVVVCPTHSIWVGDLDDANSGIAKLVNENPVEVRSPEQNTGPNVFYLGADRAVLDPLAAPVGDSYIWARPDEHRREVSADLPVDPVTQARTTLNTAHPRPWGWRVTTYLWTKAFGAGALVIAALARFLGLDFGPLGTVVAPAVGLVGVGVTGVLLVWDLKQPKRFLYLFLRPNPTSWLVWGAIVLGVFAAVAAAWFGVGVLGVMGALDARTVDAVLEPLAWASVPAAAMTAGYTAFLFNQAEGRDLWQSRTFLWQPLLFWHLIVQAVMVGAGVLLLFTAFVDVAPESVALIARSLVVTTALHVLIALLEHLGRHPTGNARAAARMMTHGRYAKLFWGGGVAAAVLAGCVAAAGWNGAFAMTLLPLAGLIVQAALLAYESVFVRAAQDVPLS